MRIPAVTALLLGTLAALPAADPPKSPLAPRTIKWEKPGGTLGEVAAALTKQSGGPQHGGVPVEVPDELRKTPCDVRFKDTPFWEALQQAADRSDTRVTLADGGRKVALVPRGASKEVAATSGAFRVVAHEVEARARLELGVVFHRVHLFIHWEPRLHVYRINKLAINKVADVPGSKPSAAPAVIRFLPDGAVAGQSATPDSKDRITVTVNGLTRASERLTVLAGEFTVAAADRLLAFAFDPTQKLPVAQKDSGVTATLKRVEKIDDTWEIEVELNYPPGQPVFESFEGEWWLKDNRLVVRSPEGKSFVIEHYEFRTRGGVTAIHRYTEDAKKGLGAPTAKGWSVVYETPAPLVEEKVPFELKNIPLP
jgi:hypothetical protein